MRFKWTVLTHLHIFMGTFFNTVNLNKCFLNSYQGYISWAFPLKLSSDECHKTSSVISQHWFRKWLDAVRQQAIAWANVNPDQCRCMASISHTNLKKEQFMACFWTHTACMSYIPQSGVHNINLAIKIQSPKKMCKVHVYWILLLTLCPSDAIWRYSSGSILAQVMDCCLTSPIKPLPELTVAYHHLGPATSIWSQFHKRYVSY